MSSPKKKSWFLSRSRSSGSWWSRSPSAGMKGAHSLPMDLPPSSRHSPLCRSASPTTMAFAQHARVVDDVAADDGEDRSNLLEVLVWYGEVIAVENDEVGQLAFLDGSQLILLAQEPPIPLRVELQDFLTRDLLVGVDQHASCVQAGCGKVHVEPRIHRRDLHAIRRSEERRVGKECRSRVWRY